ncbi:MAG: thioredoxin domain-containing protein [Burkholderiales bacterium]|nr:thioredoxin domain-containing protein [Burkholderiales bacterium]
MKKLALFAAIILAMIAALLFATKSYKDRQAEAVQQIMQSADSPLRRGDVPMIGTIMAKVEIVEFFDPACEGCRAFHPYVKSVLDTNGPRVRLVLRYAAFHAGSDQVVMLLEAARMQGTDIYARVLDSILETQPRWADHTAPRPDMVWKLVEGTGLDIGRARKDADDPAIKARLRQDAEDIVKLDIRKTPTFFVNGKPLREFSPEGLARQVAEEIRAHYGQ